MLWRISFFLLWQLAGGGLGWWQGGPWGAALGAAIAAWMWFVWDLLRSVRVLRWLRTGDLASVPSMRGIWGEAADRARRLLRKQEAQIRDSQDRLQEILAALQASPNGVVLLDAQGRIEWCNQMAANHFGFDAQRDVMQSIGNLLRNPEFTAYFAAKDFTSDVVLEGRLSTPSRPVRISVHLHPYGDGRTLLLSRDVTALEQADAMRRDFVANVSHELRTPLTAIQGYAETLISLDASPECRRFGEIILKHGVSLSRMVDDLLTLARLEGKTGSLELNPVDPREAVSQAVGMCREALERRKCSVVVDIPESCRVRASLPHLAKIFRNLIENAGRYAPEGSSVRISARESGPDVVIRVVDDGPGIPKVDLERVFERFYQVERHRGQATTGLGLAICKHIVERHGGRIRAESPTQDGSTALVFTLSSVHGAAL